MKKLGKEKKERKDIILIIIAIVLIVSLMALTEHFMGRLFLGPDGKFGLWDGNIMSSENSQRVADVYSFTHIIHGIVFFSLLWLFARKLPVKYRFLIVILIECAWEILENSPFIIERYRTATIGLGYFGDSIINSISDVIFMSIGFYIAYKFPKWLSITVIIVIEVLLLIFVRDNLTLNIIMLFHEFPKIKEWQMEIYKFFIALI